MVEVSVPEGLDQACCDPPIGGQVWLDQPGGKYLVVDSHISHGPRGWCSGRPRWWE